MKHVEIQNKINRAEKVVLSIVAKAYKNKTGQLDLIDYRSLVKKEFMKLKNETKDLVCFYERLQY